MGRLRAIVIGVVAVGMVTVAMVAAQERGRARERTRTRRVSARSVYLISLFGTKQLPSMLSDNLKTLPTALAMSENQKSSYEREVQAYQDAIAPLLKQLRRQTEKFQAKIDNILTVEQRGQFKNLLDRAARMTGARVRLYPSLVERAGNELNLQVAVDIAKAAREKMRVLPREQRREGRATILREMNEQLQRELSPEDLKALKDKVRELSQQRRPRGRRSQPPATD